MESVSFFFLHYSLHCVQAGRLGATRVKPLRWIWSAQIVMRQLIMRSLSVQSLWQAVIPTIIILRAAKTWQLGHLEAEVSAWISWCRCRRL